MQSFSLSPPASRPPDSRAADAGCVRGPWTGASVRAGESRAQEAGLSLRLFVDSSASRIRAAVRLHGRRPRVRLPSHRSCRRLLGLAASPLLSHLLLSSLPSFPSCSPRRLSPAIAARVAATARVASSECTYRRLPTWCARIPSATDTCSLDIRSRVAAPLQLCFDSLSILYD